MGFWLQYRKTEKERQLAEGRRGEGEGEGEESNHTMARKGPL